MNSENQGQGQDHDTLPVCVTIETIDNRDQSIEAVSTNVTAIGREQYMKLKISAKNVDQDVENDKTHLIIAADFSGSMAGNPVNQVKDAIKDILSSTLQSPDITTDVIKYDTEAVVLNVDEYNYVNVIDGLKAGSMTNFVKVFNTLDELLKNGDESTARAIIVFMTDGCDTCNSNIGVKTFEWTESLKHYQREITIHTVGFSRNHNYEFMKKLAEAGNTEGMFRYCEPSDGQTVLQEKLQELFDFIVLRSKRVSVTVTVDGDNKLMHNGELQQTCTLEADVMATNEGQDNYEILADVWIYLPDPQSTPNLTVTVNKEVKRNVLLTFPCEVISMERKVLQIAADRTLWNLRMASRNADILSVKVSEVISDKGDATRVRERLSKLQEKLKDTQIFGRGITKELREDMTKFMKEITAKIDMMHSMLASYIRGETQSVTMLARAHDMRYQCKFSKSRRQRLMDKRAAKNMSHAKSAQDQLSMLQVDKQEVGNISHDAVGFYFCALSQNSVKDVLLGSDIDDAIGFGLAVKRPEHVLDEPTAIRLWNISGTLVSRNAMLDALEYKIKIDGHLSAHGGFKFNDSTLGVTTVGLSREPINAWLPLYVSQSHWDRVKVLLKPTLGYFCTLDPLGYDFKQMDTMFMVLGNMIGQLSEQSVGEHQIKLIFAFQRTCYACVKDFDLTEQICDIIQKFIDSPAGRTKDVIPNLFVLIGYIASLPASRIQAIFKPDVGKLSEYLRRFWLAYLAEVLRRAANYLYRETSTNVINGILDVILHGKAEEVTTDCYTDKTDVKLIQQCHSSEVNDSTFNVDIPTFDPAAGVTLPAEEEFKLDSNLEKAMEIWARAEFKAPKAKHQVMGIKKATACVKNWMKNLKESITVGSHDLHTQSECGLEDSQSDSDTERSEENKNQSEGVIEEGKDDNVQSEATNQNSSNKNNHSNPTGDFYDAQHITKSLIDLLAMLNRNLCKTAFPALTSIPGCIAFINFWLANDEDFRSMDENSGLPPHEWINAIKEAVIHIYKEVFVCEIGTEKEAEDPNILVAMATNEELQERIEIQTYETSVADSEEQREVTAKHNTGNHDNEDPDDSDPDDDLDIYSDYEDDIDYTDTANLKSAKKKNKRKRDLSIPELLHVINCDLDLVQMMRVVCCQAVKYHSNSQARSAIQGKHFTDLSATDSDCEEELRRLHEYLQTYRENALQNMIDSFVWRKANRYMINTPSVWSFIGYLMNTYTERKEGFSELISTIMRVDNDKEIPELQVKIQILFSGKYDDKPVIAKGNVWLPDNKMAKKLSTLLGQEDWLQIEVDLRSNLQLHVYRASDIPNRHGHCNSNPYIPNCLRAKLGMPLLKVKNRRRNHKRLISKFTK